MPSLTSGRRSRGSLQAIILRERRHIKSCSKIRSLTSVPLRSNVRRPPQDWPLARQKSNSSCPSQARTSNLKLPVKNSMHLRRLFLTIFKTHAWPHKAHPKTFLLSRIVFHNSLSSQRKRIRSMPFLRACESSTIRSQRHSVPRMDEELRTLSQPTHFCLPSLGLAPSTMAARWQVRRNSSQRSCGPRSPSIPAIPLMVSTARPRFQLYQISE